MSLMKTVPAVLILLLFAGLITHAGEPDPEEDRLMHLGIHPTQLKTYAMVAGVTALIVSPFIVAFFVRMKRLGRTSREMREAEEMLATESNTNAN